LFPRFFRIQNAKKLFITFSKYQKPFF